MGPDRIQRPAHQRRLLHEHPAVGHRGVYRREEHGQLGSGPHQVRLVSFFLSSAQVCGAVVGGENERRGRVGGR